MGMYDSLDKIGLKAVLEAIKSKIPTSLPANGGNADTVGGKSASDFVLALTEAQTVNTRILIPDNVDVVDWLINNAKSGTLYFRTQYSSGQSNLPLGTNNWAWFMFDGNRFFARVMVSDSSTRDFLLNKVNLIGGWKEIYTSANKPYVKGSATAAANSNVCVSNHGFIPSAIIWWDGEASGVSASFDDTQFTINKINTYDRTIGYLIFK